MGPAYAELNALGRGPVIVTLPALLMHDIANRAAQGETEYQQLQLDMFRLAAIYLMEGMHKNIIHAVTTVLKHCNLVLVSMSPITQQLEINYDSWNCRA